MPERPSRTRPAKVPYTVSCAGPFRDAVLALARRRGVNAADVARSILLCVDGAALARIPDPGDAPPGDRETVAPSPGRPFRRKPRLQMRLPAGLDAPAIRRALALALDLDAGRAAVTVADAGRKPEAEVREEISRLMATVAALSFDPLAGGVRTIDEALFVLGLPPGRVPPRAAVEARFRLLATIHHPDNPTGSHARMTQVNEAARLLRARAGRG